MKMLADNVLVRPEPWPETKLGAILMPDNSAEKKNFARGVVKEVGPGLFLSNGDRPPIEAEVGDHILFYKSNGVQLIVDKLDMVVISERTIIAILEPGDFGELEESTEEKNNV